VAGARTLRDGLMLIETKGESGDGPADRALKRLGAEPVSLSKYRVGIGLLSRGEVSAEPAESERFFH
jgi:hypothetical protein